MLDIKRLRYFTTLASTGNFTRAASELGIAQSALSISIRKLEEQLAMKLINRQEKQMSLTSEGKILLKHAQRILEDVHQAEKEMGELKGLSSGVINFGAPAMLGSYLLPDALARFKRHYPGIQINIVEAGTASLVKMLLQGQLDIALIRSDNVPDQVRHVTLLKEEIVALVPNDHPLVEAGSITLDAFCKYPLVLFREGYFLREAVSQYCRTHNLTLNLQFETNLVELLKALVRKGVGISTCLPGILDQDNSLTTIPFTPSIALDLGIGWKSSHYLSNASRAFIQFMEQEIGTV